MTMVLSLIVILTQLLIIASSKSITSSENQEFAFARCEPNREKCRDCYFALVKSLLGSADNVFNLIKAFSPPGENEPEYVIVTYTFSNDTMNQDKNWFWSKSVAYYMFPMGVLQKLSLFLSKDELKYQQQVRVTLNATECWGVTNDYMTLLTQKLHTYVRAQSIMPHLDNSYSALAVNNETFDDIVGTSLADTVLACPVVAIILVFIIVVMLLAIYSKRDQWKMRPPLTKGSKATLLSLAVTNASYAFFVFGMDTSALSSRQQLYPIHGQGKVGEPYNILHNIPVVVIVLDLIATLPSYLTASPVYCYINGNMSAITDNQYYIFALSTLGVIISLLNHTPYMVMAYFIDPYYTTGVLIFYFFHVLSWFSLLEFIFDSWLRKPQNDRDNAKSRKCKRICAYSTLFFFLLLSYIGLAYTVLLYLVEIPIKPVFIAIGSFAMYKLVSRRKQLWNRQITAQGTRQPEEYETQDHSQDAEQQPLLTPQ